MIYNNLINKYNYNIMKINKYIKYQKYINIKMLCISQVIIYKKHQEVYFYIIKWDQAKQEQQQHRPYIHYIIKKYIKTKITQKV